MDENASTRAARAQVLTNSVCTPGNTEDIINPGAISPGSTDKFDSPRTVLNEYVDPARVGDLLVRHRHHLKRLCKMHMKHRDDQTVNPIQHRTHII